MTVDVKPLMTFSLMPVIITYYDSNGFKAEKVKFLLFSLYCTVDGLVWALSHFRDCSSCISWGHTVYHRAEEETRE